LIKEISGNASTRTLMLLLTIEKFTKEDTMVLFSLEYNAIAS
jgi:hypothetical protein